MQSCRGRARSCTVLLTRGPYGFATNESRCLESAQSVDRQDALRPPDTLGVRYRSGLSDVGASAVVRCHESVTSRYVRAWTGSDGDVRKTLQINKYRVQRSSGESTSWDLKFAQCRFESDWGHQSPYGSRILTQDSAFRVVAWTSAAYHGFERTTETADFRSARDERSSLSHLRILQLRTGLGLDGGLCGWLAVTRLSQPDHAELTDLVDSRDKSVQS
ncbi:hypothetical protein A3L23_00483 [Rhodococcoides fascians D188]|nr:hypothetical protein A3L23_00483 [Rhodococcus fascians D188]